MIALGFFLLGVVVGIAFLAACMAWDGDTTVPVPAWPSDPPPDHDAPDYDANIAARWVD